MPEKTRCFIALELPSSIISEILELQETLKKQDLIIGKFTETENIHLTLKFLGSISDGEIEQTKRKLREVKMNKFEASLGETGVFSEEFVRIVWVTLDGQEVLDLQKKIDTNLANLFSPEDVFMSHITLARVKNVKDKIKLINFANKMKVNKIKGQIKSFALMKSILKPSGAEYEVIERYNLS
jgi:RNA 2',3'-cyclic 3'-phosphodiesterase